ncbi:MAG: leucine-rich repeat protein [Lachnospiraceae bacterium]|nr:leucine-rich repeat protein [Lachnospiraceae bacterium]
MALRNTTGVWFSELKDNREECSLYWIEFGKRKYSRYRHYGDLPGGQHYGAGLLSAFGDPWGLEMAILIVYETGELALDASLPREDWPEALAASPSGRSLIWFTKDHRLIAWLQGEEGFVSWDCCSLYERLGERLVRDAVMHADGILEILCEDGTKMGYFCDADAVLLPRETGWLPIESEAYKFQMVEINGKRERNSFTGMCPDTLPDSITIMIRKDDFWGYYAGCGAKHICFEPGLEIIPDYILPENPELESVVIPEHVQKVGFRAFHNCVNLKELVIEGDLSRVAGWDEDAFEGCPCEGYYKRIRTENKQEA